MNIETIRKVIVFIVAVVAIGFGCWVLFLAVILTGAHLSLQNFLGIGIFKIDSSQSVTLRHSISEMKGGEYAFATVEVMQKEERKIIPKNGHLKVNGINLRRNNGQNLTTVFYNGTIPKSDRYRIEVLFSSEREAHVEEVLPKDVGRDD